MIRREFENGIIYESYLFLGKGHFYCRRLVYIANHIAINPPAPDLAQEPICKFVGERFPSTMCAKYFRFRDDFVGVPLVGKRRHVLDKIIGKEVKSVAVTSKRIDAGICQGQQPLANPNRIEYCA